MSETLEQEWPVTFSGTSWVTPEEVELYWPDAQDMDFTVLERYVYAAYEQCAAFAPALAEEQLPPESWKVAQVMQARAIYRSAVAGRSDTIGEDGLSVTVFPMDWTVKNLLRPKRGRYTVR